MKCTVPNSFRFFAIAAILACLIISCQTKQENQAVFPENWSIPNFRLIEADTFHFNSFVDCNTIFKLS
ncbi:MAG TPA: hypothetical protein PKD70_07000 [Saprospiraceae bacterium]|nr:hypothetical protein [Saprospiraceae bacterium]HMP13609.1 hypothetical protein [Saprospiraceae bacterium]